MKLDLQIQCRLSFHIDMKAEAPATAVDTRDMSNSLVDDGIPNHAWRSPEDDDLSVEHVRVMTAPDEDLAPGQLLLAARGVSIEVNVYELEKAIAAIKAVEGAPR